MSKRLLWTIAIFMAFAMIGLIIVQAYWINNAIQVKEKQFSQLVNRALLNIVSEVERQEAVFRLISEINKSDSNDEYEEFVSFDIIFGPSGAGQEPELKVEKKQGKKVTDDEIYIYERSISSTGKKNITVIAEDTALFLEEPGIDMDTAGGNSITWISPGMMRAKIQQQISSHDRIFLDNIISQMMTPELSIEKRIDPDILNKIIRKELLNNDVDLDYEFAVLNGNQDVALSSENFSPELNSGYFSARLFPQDIFAVPSYLSLYFPRKKNFIFHSLGFMATSSVFLTLLIILSFTITIYIIFRQKKLSEIKNDFINNMTHELKTPISTISLASQMLNDDSIPASSKNLSYISGIVEEESKRLGYQVEKVLQMAIFDRGKIKLKLKSFEMHELINNVVNNFTLQVENKKGKIQTILNAEDDLLMIDSVHITNVLSNLIDNAIKYTDKKPEITISTENRNGRFILKVKDNGIGIKKEDQKRIFEKFYRVPMGNVHNVKGFGLGLSYVKKIVEEHHGNIRLKSEVNKGTEFEICIPVHHQQKKQVR